MYLKIDVEKTKLSQLYVKVSDDKTPEEVLQYLTKNQRVLDELVDQQLWDNLTWEEFSPEATKVNQVLAQEYAEYEGTDLTIEP